jgi:hypothetical protein
VKARNLSGRSIGDERKSKDTDRSVRVNLCRSR